MFDIVSYNRIIYLAVEIFNSLIYDTIVILIRKFHHCIKFGAENFNAPKRNSKWRPPPSWIYFRWLFLTYCRHYAIKLNHHTKFHENISIYDWIIITFWISRWRPSAMLDFLKPDFWPMRSISLHCRFFHHGTKFCVKNDRRRNYGRKWKSNMAAVRHLVILHQHVKFYANAMHSF